MLLGVQSGRRSCTEQRLCGAHNFRDLWLLLGDQSSPSILAAKIGGKVGN